MQQIEPITIRELIDVARSELIRLEFRPAQSCEYEKQMRIFTKYCASNNIIHYNNETGRAYFKDRYNLDIWDHPCHLTSIQQKTHRMIRFLDDIYEFGFTRRNSYHDYKIPEQYKAILEAYLSYCSKNRASKGTLRVKRAKLRIFFEFLQIRGIHLIDVASKDISEFVTTLAGYSRSSLHIFTSVLSCFFRYLHEIGTLKNDLSPHIPKTKKYREENIPETWTPEEIQKLLEVIDRTNNIGKRDYAMILLAILLGMRAGDICALKFRNLDWKSKLITYTQQKTGKVNTLPILPEIGDAIIDYLKNGRIESDCDNIFVKHQHPYGAISASTTLGCSIKRYMGYAGLKIKDRKATHSLRHTLASSLLYEQTPLMTISNVLGHFNQRATVGYIKVDIISLRKCALSYGKEVLAE